MLRHWLTTRFEREGSINFPILTTSLTGTKGTGDS